MAKSGGHKCGACHNNAVQNHGDVCGPCLGQPAPASPPPTSTAKASPPKDLPTIAEEILKANQDNR